MNAKKIASFSLGALVAISITSYLVKKVLKKKTTTDSNSITHDEGSDEGSDG